MNPLIRKLERFSRLSDADKRLLQQAATARIVNYDTHQDIIAEGEEPRDVNLILAGWVCRYKQLADGSRQIMSFLLPGDLCDLNIFILRRMDHALGTLTPVVAAKISRDLLQEMLNADPRLTRALWWEVLVTAAIHREWLVNIGRRTALERVAHVLCEVFVRQQAVGRVRDGRCELPITQVELADALGLSAVHVNRTLRELRQAGLIDWRDKQLAIPDIDTLTAVARFDPDYLHLDYEGERFDARC
ncbi:Crp/Fnr family transcriptional regulator [Methylobacterium frigidaeris]|uniref:Nitrogen fixation regulation protein FixK n=1 Tax=Methylobacterium frigidaeris TaxID=2038277 RepID=A0AA37M2X0_9HYPH|nr:Crp/Fnr family transcriptional regulator [Methylobacterium frigidaeris]PIK71712.1 cyclic nucleotide-binding protein [Methylobacterium frigidaeris]GJD60685.1 Nitrogen fixation regulation protein FixK [Methylobacterium frigidaeris]